MLLTELSEKLDIWVGVYAGRIMATSNAYLLFLSIGFSDKIKKNPEIKRFILDFPSRANVTIRVRERDMRVEKHLRMKYHWL